MLKLKILCVRDQPQEGSHDLVGHELTIGRAPENDLAFPDERMSRQHARIVESGGGYVLVDCGSMTGSFVNGERVTGERELRDGDRVRFGGTELQVVLPAAARLACACGQLLPADARFCASCGAPAGAPPAPAGAPAPAEIPRTVFRPAVEPAPAGPGSVVASPAPAAVAVVSPQAALPPTEEVRLPEIAAALRPPPASAAARSSRTRRAVWPLVALGVVVLLVAGGVGALVWWRHEKPAPSAAPATASVSPGSAVASPSRPDAARPPVTAVEVASGTVVPPANVAVAGLRVLAPTESGVLDAQGRYRVASRAAEGQPPFVAVTGASGQALLLGEAGGELSTRSTALALVLLDPEVARRGGAGRAAIRTRAQADARLAELARLVEQAVAAHPTDPLGGDDSGPLYRLAAAITRDALAATEAAGVRPSGSPAPASAPSHALHAAGPAGPEGGVVELAAPGGPSSADDAVCLVEDDPGHKTDDVVAVNTAFSHYRVSVERDGSPVAELKRALLTRNKPYSFLRAAWPPVGRFETRRTLAAGNGKLVFTFEQDTELTIIDIFATFVGALLGTSGLPSLKAEEDIRILMASLGQLSAAVRDFKILLEKGRHMTSLADVSTELAAFFAVRGTMLCIAMAPLYARTFKEEYIKVLGTAVAKKAIFALTTGYYAADMSAAAWSLSHQPERLVLPGEQRWGVLPPIELTVKVREKASPAPAEGRLFAVGAKLAQVPDDMSKLELRFSYPGDPGEDVETIDTRVTTAAARDHRFVKAVEAVVSAHRDGKVVAKGAAALAAPASSSDTFAFERAGWLGAGRITIEGQKIEGRHAGKHKLAPHDTELSLDGSFDPATRKGSGTIRGADTMRAYGRVFRSAWQGTFEAQLEGDRLTIRFQGRFTKGAGPFRAGMQLPPSVIVARGVKPVP